METFITDTCEDKFKCSENDSGMPLSNTPSFECSDEMQENDETKGDDDDLSNKEDTEVEVKIVEADSAEILNPFTDSDDSQLDLNSFIQLAANSVAIESTPAEEQEPSLEDLASSDFIRNRQVAARSILKHLQEAGADEEAVLSVISVMCKLSVDEEFMVRSELVENFPSIALFCKTRPEDLGTVITQLVVPCTVKLLTDDQIQVRKMGHTAFLVLLENNIIEHSQLSGWICPLISELVTSGNTSEEAKIEDVSIMCKMIPYVGKELTVKFFLEPFILLCFNSVLNIRKVCAATFGTLSKTVGRDITETTILPAFIDHCNDEDASVIKKCTEVFAEVASVVCDKTRREVLSPMFITFLNDKSHFVQQAAYQSLGAFIATFADSSKSSPHNCVMEDTNKNTTCDTKEVEENKSNPHEKQVDQHEDWIDKKETLGAKHISTKNINDSLLISSSDDCFKTLNTEKTDLVDDKLRDENLNFNSNIFLQNVLKQESISSISQLSITTENRHLYLNCDNENSYNNFQYWKTPLPDIDLDIDIEEISDPVHTKNVDSTYENSSSPEKIRTVPEFLLNLVSKRAKDRNTLLDEKQKKELQDELAKTDWISTLPPPLNQRIVTHTKTGCIISFGPGIYTEMSVSDQDIVPPDLLEKYIGIVLAMSNTEEGPIHCAYNFPAVAYTLGKKYWPIIRKIHLILARDITYTVRKTIAASLHTLADMLDHDDIVKDLLPIFLDMLKDVDAVRIKCLTNLSVFLKKLDPDERRCFLPLIEGFLIVDCEHNWRFRYTVARELLPCIKLFSPSEVHDRFMCVPADYLSDRVADVRMAAVDLMAEITKSLANKETPFLLYYLDTKYRQANKWLRRQTYIFLCEKIAIRKSVPMDVFIDKIASNLLLLAQDSVPNVRLALSRCISLTLLPLGYVSSIQESRYSDLLLQAMDTLRNDVDKDVRHFAQLSKRAFHFSPQMLSPV